MRDVLAQLEQALQQQRPVAYCRLVETRGSTPQKAGATMLVFADGSQAGTLGGGCVEADVKRRALAAFSQRQPEVAVFHLDSDYGWDDGLICGGRMQVLIQPLDPGNADAAQQQDYYRRLTEIAALPRGGTEAIAFNHPQLPQPASVLFDAAGQPVAWLGVPETPAVMRSLLRSLNERPRAYAEQGVAFLPWLPRCRLIIVGGGHVGQAVGKLASELDFDIWIVDDRAEFTSPERFPFAEQRIHGDIEAVLPALDVTPESYCLIVTRGHSHDERALFHLVQRGARYVGLIGSRRKIRLIFEDLLEAGVPAEALERVYAPLGIQIGSQTVPEIAVSICAELVAHRNLDGHVPGRPQRVSVAQP